MSKNKLEKFADMAQLPNVYEYPFAVLKEQGSFPYKGRWHADIFGNDHPIVLELGCGRGEYTVGMARRFPEKNFIGVDIKGNRMWTGATIAHQEQLPNVRFLRTSIELLGAFFASNEVAEIWITFPDPQMKKVRKRLTSIRFLELYHTIMPPEGIIHLKSDSPFLYTFTKALVTMNGLDLLADVPDTSVLPNTSVLRSITTYYESQWLARGLTIKYLSFTLAGLSANSFDPDIDIEYDSYRSYGRQGRNSIKIH